MQFVVRCKCVCKSWSTLVSDPYFQTLDIEGSVRLCKFYLGPESRLSLYVWDLKEDDEWCFKELVDLHPFLPSVPMTYRLLAFDPNDEDILYLWRKEQPSETLDILMCNIRTLTATEISQKFSSSSTFPLRSFQFVLPWWRWPTPVSRLNQLLRTVPQHSKALQLPP
ncbi:hypothetical protein ACLB2K_014184 [Fragaria x ananassa]